MRLNCERFSTLVARPFFQRQARLFFKSLKNANYVARDTIRPPMSFGSVRGCGGYLMNTLTKAILVAASASALTAGSASVAIVCNDDDDYWHVRGRPHFPAQIEVAHLCRRLEVEYDRDHYRWREHAGRGYWRKGVSINIRLTRKKPPVTGGVSRVTRSPRTRAGFANERAR